MLKQWMKLLSAFTLGAAFCFTIGLYFVSNIVDRNDELISKMAQGQLDLSRYSYSNEANEIIKASNALALESSCDGELSSDIPEALSLTSLFLGTITQQPSKTYEQSIATALIVQSHLRDNGKIEAADSLLVAMKSYCEANINIFMSCEKIDNTLPSFQPDCG
ncbi:hypothetical protein [Enterovibrio calviensis]|uniref:hypothetical protein n=1 Tax=Enterovibrio calviensis TaxID=91359 RepID=UPI000AD6E597|nr:hypothetical protein [Enterovibrio calviensis]